MRAVVCQACLGVHSSSEGGRGASGMDGDGGIEDEEKDREEDIGEREANDFRRSGGCVGEDDDDEAGGLKLQLYLTAAVSMLCGSLYSNAAAASHLACASTHENSFAF